MIVKDVLSHLSTSPYWVEAISYWHIESKSHVGLRKAHFMIVRIMCLYDSGWLRVYCICCIIRWLYVWVYLVFIFAFLWIFVDETKIIYCVCMCMCVMFVRNVYLCLLCLRPWVHYKHICIDVNTFICYT